MNRKNCLVLIALAALVSTAAWWAGQREQARYELADGGALYPELEAALAQVDTVAVHPADAEAFTLRLDGERWGLVERGGYPVDTTVLRRELRKLATAQRVEAKTANPAYYDRLGVQDIESASNPTVRLTLQAGDLSLADVLIGKAGQAGHYLRPVGAEQSWLTDTRFDLPGQPAKWLERTVIELPRDRLARITVTPPAGSGYAVERATPEHRDFTLSPLPEGREPDVANINRLAAALARLRFDDVAATPEDPAADGWTVTELRSFDGLVITAWTLKGDGNAQLRLSARYEAPPASAEENPAEGDETETAEDPAAVAKRVQAEVEAINARTTGWTYEIPTYAANALSFTHESLLKDKPQE